MALPTRLSSTCRSRPASPTSASGTSGCTWQTSSSPLLWARTARARSVSPTAARREKSAGSSSSLPASILAEVEQVVDDDEQVVGRRLDRFETLPLVFGQRRVQGQFGHAEDGVHGRANLVADVGQELVLGSVGRLRRVLGPPQLGLLLLALDAQGDQPSHRFQRLKHGPRQGPAGEHGEHAQQTIRDHEGEAGESDHAFASGPLRITDARVALNLVGQHRPTLLGDPADLELADGDAGVRAVQMGILSRAGL